MEQKIESDEMGCSLLIETGFDHPSTITEITGVNATQIFVKGGQYYSASTKVAIPGKVYERNLWELKSEVFYGHDKIFINHAVESMLKIFDLKENEFKEVFKKYPTSILRCYAYYYQLNSYFHFTTEILSRLASYNIGIEFYIYSLNEDEKEKE